jgi:hypothetical protein
LTPGASAKHDAAGVGGLRLAAPLKAWTGAAAIFLRHAGLLPWWRAFPAVAAFRLAWYRAILESWPAA